MNDQTKTHDERAYEALLDGLFDLRHDYGAFGRTAKTVLERVNALLAERRLRPFSQRQLERALFLMESFGPLPMDYHHVALLGVRSVLFSVCGRRALIVYNPFGSAFFVQCHTLPYLLIGALQEKSFVGWPHPSPGQLQSKLDWRLCVRSFFEMARNHFTSKQGFIPFQFPWSKSSFTSLTTCYELIARYSKLKARRDPLLRVFRKLPPLLKRFTQRTEEHDYVLTVDWRSIVEFRSPFSAQQLDVASLIPNAAYRNELNHLPDPMERLVKQLTSVFRVELSARYLTDLYENVDGRMDSRTNGFIKVWGFLLEFFHAILYDEQQTAIGRKSQ